jgi:hypothetical protein
MARQCSLPTVSGRLKRRFYRGSGRRRSIVAVAGAGGIQQNANPKRNAQASAMPLPRGLSGFKRIQVDFYQSGTRIR